VNYVLYRAKKARSEQRKKQLQLFSGITIFLVAGTSKYFIERNDENRKLIELFLVGR